MSKMKDFKQNVKDNGLGIAVEDAFVAFTKRHPHLQRITAPALIYIGAVLRSKKEAPVFRMSDLPDEIHQSFNQNSDYLGIVDDDAWGKSFGSCDDLDELKRDLSKAADAVAERYGIDTSKPDPFFGGEYVGVVNDDAVRDHPLKIMPQGSNAGIWSRSDMKRHEYEKMGLKSFSRLSDEHLPEPTFVITYGPGCKEVVEKYALSQAILGNYVKLVEEDREGWSMARMTPIDSEGASKGLPTKRSKQSARIAAEDLARVNREFADDNNRYRIKRIISA